MTDDQPAPSGGYNEDGEREDLSSRRPPTAIVLGIPALIVGVLAVLLGVPWWIVLIVLGLIGLAIITNG